MNGEFTFFHGAGFSLGVVVALLLFHIFFVVRMYLAVRQLSFLPRPPSCGCGKGCIRPRLALGISILRDYEDDRSEIIFRFVSGTAIIIKISV